jgi:hypothetical protein
VFSFGRANIKGKLGKRLTQNLESHHSSDFLFTMRGGGRGIGGIGGNLWQHGRRQGQTGTDWHGARARAAAGACASESESCPCWSWSWPYVGKDLTDGPEGQMTKEHLARGRTSMLPLSPTKWPYKDGAKGESITK